MNKTPEEIKQGLEGLKFIANAGRIDDALALIQQLEAENTRKHEKIIQLYNALEEETKIIQDVAEYSKMVFQNLESQKTELLEKVDQLTVERDAAVKDMYAYCACDVCKHNDPTQTICPRGQEADCCFEWRGVQKESINE